MTYKLPKGTRVLVNYNDETGADLFSIEPENDTGNWIESFGYLTHALNFIEEQGYMYDHKTGYRDTRYNKGEG